MGQTNVRMAGPALVTNAAATVYTCPAQTKATVQYIQVSNPSASAVTFTMSIGAQAAGTSVFNAYSIAPGTVLSLPVRYTLTAAEIIQVLAGTTNVLVLLINGIESTP